MTNDIRIKTALISVYHKEGLEKLVNELKNLQVEILSTGGTAQYLKSMGVEPREVEDITGYPSILGGRVKTLHPAVHGGILARRDNEGDIEVLQKYEIPTIDLVVIDLYPFEDTVASGADEDAITEKIDIGGVALMRAAAKNHKHVCCVPSSEYYDELASILAENNGSLSWEHRKKFAAYTFDITSHYDTKIFSYLNPEHAELKISEREATSLRYGENPHQKGQYFGDLTSILDQLNGKALSYNNLVDVDAALQLISEFSDPAFAIIKHTNPCGCAVADNIKDAWVKALAGDPISAFGGILISNRTIDKEVASEIHKQFYEVLIAPDYEAEALELLKEKKKRIILKQKDSYKLSQSVKSVVNGFLIQDTDSKELSAEDISIKSSRQPTDVEMDDIFFGDKVCKHLKSNAIAIVKNKQLIGSGMGQTSRIDAIRHAIAKAKHFEFELKGSILVSDAFFPFSDSAELAWQNGIEVIAEPGGSVRDEETINFCENHSMCLIFTSVRRFKH